MTVILASESAFGTNEVRLSVRSLAEAEVRRGLYLWAIDQAGGSLRRAARALGVPRSTFAERCKRLGLIPVTVEVAE